MKTLSYFLVTTLLLIFAACSDKNSNLVAPYESGSASSQGKVIETAVLKPGDPTPLFTKYDLALYGLPQVKAVDASNPSARRGGTYTVSGNLHQIYSRRKVILGTNQSLYPPGAYFCDVYICDYTQTVPQGQFIGLTGSSKTGYNDYNTQTTGINSTQTLNPNNSSTYYFSTFSMVPIYNENGQYIYNGTLPQDLTGLTYTYVTYP